MNILLLNMKKTKQKELLTIFAQDQKTTLLIASKFCQWQKPSNFLI